jgi:hypothetical protein
MAFSTQYGINLQVDGTQPPEKQWQAVVLYKPTTPTVPTVTTGPLGATGTATAQYSHGDGTVTGFASPLDAFQRALILIENDRPSAINDLLP